MKQSLKLTKQFSNSKVVCNAGVQETSYLLGSTSLRHKLAIVCLAVMFDFGKSGQGGGG